MSDVTHYKSLPFFAPPKKGLMSWSGMFVSMAVSLFIVAGLSFTLNIINQHITKSVTPDIDRLVSGWLAQSVGVPSVEAATQYSELNRTTYNTTNKNVYTRNNTPVSVVKTTVSKTLVVKATTVVTAKPKAVSLASASLSSPVNATRLIQNASTLTLGKKATSVITVGFKNTGSTNWPTSGLVLRSAATLGSYFSHNSWKSTTIVKDAIQTAKPGELIYVTFTIEAPNNLGNYQDTFYLTYNGNKINGTDTQIKVNVTNALVPDTQISSKPLPRVVTVSQTIATPSVVVSTGTFNAIPLIQSGNTLSLGQLQTADFQIGWKNTGTAAWKVGDTIRLRSSARTESYFHTSSWEDGVWVTTIKTDVQPGGVAFTTFKIEAPAVVGTYSETFTLYHGATPMSSAHIVLPMQVIGGTAPKVQIAQEGTADTTPTVSQPSVVPTPVTSTQVINALTETEPIIRVGLFNTRDTVKVTANKAFEVRDGSGQALASLASGAIASVTFDFTQKIYTITTDSASTTTPSLVRFVGAGSPQTGMPDQDTVFDIVSYTDHPGWSSVLNDNRFRSAIELRYAASKDTLWVINELSLENYLKGLGETSNSSPYEFQKALATAARTYAKIVSRTPKYTVENFHVRNTDADQVYRGYSSEIRMPQFVKAVLETRGIIVTYNGTIVITPYFSNSDGRTRSWEEAWAGAPKPWLKSVDDPYCAGLKLWGHGVGMSARGAVGMAANGNTYDQILTHYYTGVNLTRVY